MDLKVAPVRFGSPRGAGATLRAFELYKKEVVMAKDRGPCQWEIKKGVTCGEPATAEVRIRDKAGSARVPVCEEHRATYNRRAAQLRVG